MSYTVKSLDEIALLFDERAAECQARANRSAASQKEAANANGEATAWLRAAYILRRTTLTQDMEATP